MNPVPRPLGTDGPTPHGWRAEPAGRWPGRDVEVVYDPRRHDVLVAANGCPTASGKRSGPVGFELTEVAGRDELRIRDRVAGTRAGLARIARTPAAIETPAWPGDPTQTRHRRARWARATWSPGACGQRACLSRSAPPAASRALLSVKRG
jgi:hypothetical protein